MADRSANSGPHHRSRLIALGLVGERDATSDNNQRIGERAQSEGSIQATIVLSAHSEQYVLSCCHQWHAAESEAPVESRPPLHAAGCRKHPVDGVGLQYRGAVTHGLAR